MGATPIENATVVRGMLGTAADAAEKRRGSSSAWVTFHETVKLALDSLRAHKLRSFLTLLGVILAVATLVSVMSVIAGLNKYIADRVADLGANVFVIDRFGIITSMDAYRKAQKRPLITLEEFERYRDSSRLAEQVAGYDQQYSESRSGDALLENTKVVGVTSNYAEIENLTLAQGRFITPADEQHHSEVAFIGADLADKFFPNVDPIGKTVRSENHIYEVIGVGGRIGSALGRSKDNYMLLPLSTYLKGWHRPNDSLAIIVQVQNAESMAPAEEEARMLLRAWRHLSYKAEDNFAFFASDSIMAVWHELTGNLAFVTMALVSVFLVVGGIVIMNIMLASVTERTREIGLRRSLGARKQHILLQFLTESALLAATGGLIGIFAAIVIVLFVKYTFSFPMDLPISAVILSLFLATSVGLFFGIFPAMRAAKLDPIEALRAEA
ncbi:MAG TPA: ABC transporter permease [Candidatus Eremiobacteraceae bacterium]|nr:ABC transporter permease [Candidatus Eremiobacteraceae bacterium]